MAESSARVAGRLLAARRRRLAGSESDPNAPELEWPALRRAILAKGGIGPSRDWDRSDYPGDLYREHGLPPDVLAVELTLGRSDVPPWGPDADDNTMLRYLDRAHRDYAAHPERRYSIADPALAAGRRELAASRTAEQLRTFGAGKAAREQAAHHGRISAFVARARAQRAAGFKAPAVGFYTDRKDVVHPITKTRRAGAVYALRRGK